VKISFRGRPNRPAPFVEDRGSYVLSDLSPHCRRGTRRRALYLQHLAPRSGLLPLEEADHTRTYSAREVMTMATTLAPTSSTPTVRSCIQAARPNLERRGFIASAPASAAVLALASACASDFLASWAVWRASMAGHKASSRVFSPREAFPRCSIPCAAAVSAPIREGRSQASRWLSFM
jgi:hypothetical protein